MMLVMIMMMMVANHPVGVKRNGIGRFYVMEYAKSQNYFPSECEQHARPAKHNSTLASFTFLHARAPLVREDIAARGKQRHGQGSGVFSEKKTPPEPFRRRMIIKKRRD